MFMWKDIGKLKNKKIHLYIDDTIQHVANQYRLVYSYISDIKLN